MSHFEKRLIISVIGILIGIISRVAHAFNGFMLQLVDYTQFDLVELNRGIKHDFPFINICKVPREVLKTEGETFPRDLANVNDKIMFDRYYCINSANHCENEEKIGPLYFITSSHFPTRVRV